MKSLWPNAWEQLSSFAKTRGITPSELVKQYFRAALKSPAFPKHLDPAQFRKPGESAVSQLRGIEDASQPARVDNGSTFRVNLIMRGIRTLAQAMMPADAACMKNEQSLFSPACLKTLFEMFGADTREEEGPAPDLMMQMIEGLPLMSSRSYRGQTAFGVILSIRLSAEIVEAYESADRDVVFSLLRSIYFGRGESSGIVPILGPGGQHVIELKSYNHGHKRIFGCLEGSKLVLKKFLAIKDTSASYRNHIPENFCS